MPLTTANEDNSNNLCISLCGWKDRFMIGKKVVRILDYPSYICFRVNRDRNSIIVFPCNSNDAMSYKVPKRIFDGHTFYISSKAFVHELLQKNGLNPQTNYLIPGTYLKDKNVVMFNISDAYEHTNRSVS